MNHKTIGVIGLLAIAVAVSGCTQPSLDSDSDDESITAQLIGTASDKEITEDSPGEITLNARNLRNETSNFYVEVVPTGDYDQIADITDREGDSVFRVQLGEAVGSATTGEKFVEVRKDANITATVKVKAELYRENQEDQEESLDSETYKLQMLEE